MRLGHKFVEHIPEQLDDGVLYVSIRFGTVVHKCACGCGQEVVTPLGPAEWQITYDGRTISMEPSIGNWNFPCRSHYWIEGGNVRWARKFSGDEVSLVQRKARTRRDGYYRTESTETTEKELGEDTQRGQIEDERHRSRWSRWSVWEKLRSLSRALGRGGK